MSEKVEAYSREGEWLGSFPTIARARQYISQCTTYEDVDFRFTNQIAVAGGGIGISRAILELALAQIQEPIVTIASSSDGQSPFKEINVPSINFADLLPEVENEPVKKRHNFWNSNRGK